MLSRVSLFNAFGSGTGTNKLGFAPLDIASQFTLQQVRTRGSNVGPEVRFALQVLGVPGALVESLHDVDFRKQNYNNPRELVTSKAKEVWTSAQKWTKETKLKKVLNQRDQLSGFASLAVVLSSLLALYFPKEASLVFVVGMVALQFTLKQFEHSVRIDETWGVYSIVFAAAAIFV